MKDKWFSRIIVLLKQKNNYFWTWQQSLGMRGLSVWLKNNILNRVSSTVIRGLAPLGSLL